MSGYSPSNNMAVFIPNDGTHCQGEFQLKQDCWSLLIVFRDQTLKPCLLYVACADVDECRIPGLCGDGARCTNLPGSFECSCQLGYGVQNGKETFDPRRENASCKGNATWWTPYSNHVIKTCSCWCFSGRLWSAGLSGGQRSAVSNSNHIQQRGHVRVWWRFHVEEWRQQLSVWCWWTLDPSLH